MEMETKRRVPVKMGSRGLIGKLLNREARKINVESEKLGKQGRRNEMMCNGKS